MHWCSQNFKHAGIDTVLRYAMLTAYLIKGRELMKRIERDFERCKVLPKRTIKVSMGPVSTKNIMIASTFYHTQVALAGPFKAYRLHSQLKKLYGCVFCCTATTVTFVKIMEDYSSAVFIQSFIQVAWEVRYWKKLDEGSQLLSRCDLMKIIFVDLKGQLHLRMKVEYEACPAAAHHIRGKVGRQIPQSKGSPKKYFENQRFSFLRCVILAAEISNTINNLPLALGSITRNLYNFNLDITMILVQLDH